MIINFSVKRTIEEKIKEIEEEYKQTQGLILTEDDLKCLLYNKLNEIDELSEKRETLDPGILANSIHTEVSWYDRKGKLTIKPDITILEPENLSILHKCYEPDSNPPSKQYEFHGKAIILELKFIRNKTGIRKTTLDSRIKKDFEKIKGLFSRLKSQGKEDELFCYFVIVNKTDIKCKEFDSFINQNRKKDRYKIFYLTGKVKFLNYKKTI